MTETEVQEVETVIDGDELLDSFDETFSTSYHLGHTSKIGTSYVLNVDANCDGNQVLTLGSQGEVCLFTPELQKLNFFKPHDKPVTQAAFAKSDPNLIYTSSYDGTIKLWDSRSPTKCKLEFKDQSTQSGPPSKSLKPVLCFDTTGANSLICAGTEKTGSDSYILFWDARSSNLMGGYWESHSDDVTCIKFNPDKGNVFASGDTEGMVNVFDINENDEDDALLASHNTEDSVAKMTWFRKKVKMDYLAISTHTESLQVFDTEDSQMLHNFTREDVAHSIRRTGAQHVYIVDMIEQQEQGFLLLAASRYANDKCLRFSTFRNKKLKPHINLPLDVRDRQVVRDCVQIPGSQVFVTGSEGGIVDVWKPGASPVEDSFKMKVRSDHRAKPY